MKLEELFKEMGIERDSFEDLHVTRMYSSFVAISKGKVFKMTEPFLEYCPLADSLYNNIEGESPKEAIGKAVEDKILKFGHFTANRELRREDIAIPYGASELLMYAMRGNVIDSAVVVCDGAGTVIVNEPAIVQGIGARMNGLFYTSPISTIIDKLREENSYVVFPETASIDQSTGLKKAAELGYKNIAVTINACMEEELSKIKEIEKKHNISAISVAVCTTGISKERIEEIVKYADLVWSCASEEVRKAGEKAILQLSTKIPVFVLTEKGLDLVEAYFSDERPIKDLDLRKQYLISGRYKGKRIKMGNFVTYLTEAKLPIRSEKEPRPLT